jgi:hypothetical protein
VKASARQRRGAHLGFKVWVRGCALSLRALLALALGFGAMLALASAPASAKVVHSFKFSLNGSATPGGTWGGEPGPIAAAANPPGAFFVGSYGLVLYDKFSSTGTYLCQITGAGASSTSASECDTSAPGLPAGEFGNEEVGNALDTSTGRLYFGDRPGAVDAFSSVGAYEPSQSFSLPEKPAGVAFDNSTGDVFVTNDTVVYKYDPSTTTLSTFATETPSGSLHGLRAIAVDNDPSSPAYGEVYVGGGSDGIDVFGPSGTYLRSITSTPKGPLSVIGLASDPNNGHLYALEFTKGVYEFAPSGAFVSFIGGELHPGENLLASSLAVSPSTGDVIVGDFFNNLVDVFTPDEILPDVTTATATNVQPTSETLNGTVNPSGIEVERCFFEYVADEEYEPSFEYVREAGWDRKPANPYRTGQTIPCVETVGSGNSPVSVHADVTGLQPGAVYHFRLVAENENSTRNGPSNGADELVGTPFLRERSASEIAQTTAKLNAGVNPDGVATTYQFEYGEEEGVYTHSVPASPASAGSGSTEVGISQAISGLQPNTTYHFRFVATNGSGTIHGPDQTFTSLPPALVDVLGPTEVTANAAKLNVYLNPQGSPTTYHFDYGATASYGQETPGASAGSGAAPLLQTAAISGLQPNTTYHFRTVVTNGHGAYDGPDSTFATPPTTCPNESLRTGLSARLPDCRAYEQVSPVEKIGNPAQTGSVSPTGERAAIQIGGNGLPGSQSAPGIDTYLAERGPNGWNTVGVDQPARTGALPGRTTTTSEDLSKFAGLVLNVNNFASSSSAENGAVTLRNLDGSLDEFPIENADGHKWTSFHTPYPNGGASSDLSHILITNRSPLLPSDTQPSGDQGHGSFNRVYALVGLGGPSPFLRLESVDNSGAPLTEGAGCDGDEEAFGISNDGLKVFFTGRTKLDGVCQGSLFMRLNGTTTINVTNPTPNEACTTSACRGSDTFGALVAGHSDSGSKFYFESPRQFTDDASPFDTRPAQPNYPIKQFDNETICKETLAGGCNLYEYDFNRPSGHKLAAVSIGDSSGRGPQVHDFVQVSEDGSHIYFVAGGVLTGEPNGLGQLPTPRGANLYGYDATSGTTKFIGTVCNPYGESHSDSDRGAFGEVIGGIPPNPLCPGPGEDENTLSLEFSRLAGHSAVSHDGRFLVFASYAQLTPDDTNEARDVYRYDFQTGSIVRLSVGHDGEDNNGNGGGQNANVTAGGNGFLTGPVGNSISDDGQTVIFTTARALQSTHTSGDTEVYEWHQGEVSLISGGGDSIEAKAVTVTPSGRDIFFNTSQGLLPQDNDHVYDAYDARVDGGFPPAQAPPPICEGAEACHGAGAAGPAAPILGTETFVGSSNPKETPSPTCKKSFVEKHGKCVKKKHQKKHRRAGHKHGGAK